TAIPPSLHFCDHKNQHQHRHRDHLETSCEHRATDAGTGAPHGREKRVKFSIIGAGSFGTAMAMIASRCGNDVLLWAHDPKVADGIEKNRRNPSYLAALPLDAKIRATHSLAEAAEFSDVIFMIVPSHHYRRVLTALKAPLKAPVDDLSGTNGIANETLD